MGMILAALAGAGQEYNKIAEQKQREWTAERLHQLQQQGEMQKEARINEYQKQAEARQQGYKIDDEKRGMLNKATERQQQLEFDTNPSNVKAKADAAISQQKAADEYTDSRFATTLSQERQLAQARHISDVDTVGRNLQHQLLQKQLDEINSSDHLSEAKKASASAYIKDAQDATDAANNLRIKMANLTDPAQIAEANKQLDDLMLRHNTAFDNAHKILSGGQISASPGPTKTDLEGDQNQPAAVGKASEAISKPTGMLSSVELEKAKSETKQAEDKYLHKARIYLKSGPSGNSELAQMINGIRSKKNLSDEQKLSMISDLIRTAE